MTSREDERASGWMQRRGRYRVLCWALSAVAFVAGPVIGMNLHANLGASIWVLSAVLALIPFWSHRHPMPDGEDPDS